MRVWEQNGKVYVYAPMTTAQLFHMFLVSADVLLGLVALGFGILTLLKKPLFEKQALVHKHLGRLWVFFMMITAYQSAVRLSLQFLPQSHRAANFAHSLTVRR